MAEPAQRASDSGPGRGPAQRPRRRAADRGYRAITEPISAIALGAADTWRWWVGFGLSTLLLGLFAVSITWAFEEGVGVWGNNIPNAWAFPIINFVWWIGIGHAGTFISAFLLLMRQGWRNAINRSAEAMTLFAVACAGLFPLLHLGRPQVFYWMLPYPDTMNLWPQFRSPLVWDIFAILTYFTISLLFWYTGLVPDLATLRDRAHRPWVKRVYAVLALGWRGAARHWDHYESAYLLMAGLATPLVISVHSIVGLDFAVGLTPGWHTTFMSPYFVAGALFSGFAMVLCIVIPLRAVWPALKAMITEDHLDRLGALMLTTGMMVAFSYLLEHFLAWYSGHEAEMTVLRMRREGHYAPAWYAMMALNVGIIQVLWSRRARRSVLILFLVALGVNVGMWLERFIIVITSLSYNHIPSQWHLYSPTGWDWATLAGSVGLFATLLYLFVRFVPVVSMSEMRALADDRGEAGVPRGDHEGPAPGETSWRPPRRGEPVYGLVARVETPEALCKLARRIREAGYVSYECYTPQPVEGLREAMGRPRSRLPLLVFAGGLTGAASGFLLQVWAHVWDYPMNVGGRPDFSWPSFVPVTFELMVLFAGGAAFLGLFGLSRLPRLHHPVFATPGFEAGSQESFFLCVEARDPSFDTVHTRRLLLEPVRVGGRREQAHVVEVGCEV